MACLTPNCKNAVIGDSKTWGFPVEICQTHFESRIVAISEKVSGSNAELIKDTFLQDYAKIGLLLEKAQPTVRKCLKQLAAKWKSKIEKKSAPSIEDSDDHIKLSALLAKYERMCWFPASHDIFLGFLQTAEFDGSIAKGIMAKDPGASVNHGDFTHRLQWHVIMSVITEEFSKAKRPGWNHTPLHLYTRCGESPYDGKNNVWYRLFDNNSQQDFRSPDWTNNHVSTGDYGVLSFAVSKRHLKRLMEYLKYDEAPVLKNPSTLYVAGSKNYTVAFQAFRDGYSERKNRNDKGRIVEGVTMHSPWIGKGGANIENMPISERITASYGSLNQLQNKYDSKIGLTRSPGMDDSVSIFIDL